MFCRPSDPVQFAFGYEVGPKNDRAQPARVSSMLLYAFLSPNTAAVFKDFGAAMKDPVARFWAVEHVTMMLAAVILAHVGRVLGRKASTPGAKRTRLLISFGLSTLLMIVGTPWPGLRAGRPLFRV